MNVSLCQALCGYIRNATVTAKPFAPLGSVGQLINGLQLSRCFLNHLPLWVAQNTLYLLLYINGWKCGNYVNMVYIPLYSDMK